MTVRHIHELGLAEARAVLNELSQQMESAKFHGAVVVGVFDDDIDHEVRVYVFNPRDRFSELEMMGALELAKWIK